jgi:hypothetical protein
MSEKKETPFLPIEPAAAPAGVSAPETVPKQSKMTFEFVDLDGKIKLEEINLDDSWVIAGCDMPCGTCSYKCTGCG